jgi:sulfatase maturation enzyme AslB (radical SAM superfamily)
MPEDHPHAPKLNERGFTRNNLDKKALVERWRKRFGVNFTGPSLHIAIITKGCNQACYYCHASALPDGDTDALKMDIKTADAIIDRVLESPLPNITLEFQ